MNSTNQITDSKHLLSSLSSDRPVAIAAPLIRDTEVLVGYALSPEERYCAVVTLNEFISICPSLYFQVNTPRVFHGLKRIWEFLDRRGLHTDTDININKIDDTKLIAYLLDPDSGRNVDFGKHRVQTGLTLAHLCSRYLEEDYPYRNTDFCEGEPLDFFSEILAYDAHIIHRLATELPARMSNDLHKLYRDLELPLMAVLDQMRRVGIGVDGAACAQEKGRIEEEMARLAHEITGGAEVDLLSDRVVFRFLVGRQDVQFHDQRVYQWQRVFTKALEETAPYHPVVQKILDFRKMRYDLAFLRQAEGRDRVHPVWGQTRSATSRIYSRNPAVQNVSRDLRKLFVPAPGHVLVKADYSQAQMRILAHLSQDPELMRVFNNPNGDVHAETSEWLGLNDRNVAKEINFAICFGMGPAALAQKINEMKQRQGSTDLIDFTVAQSYIDGFYGKFPLVRAFFEQEWLKMKKVPPQERVAGSLVGRERRFPRRLSPEIERQFRVTWPQQIEADLIKTAALRVDRIFRRRIMKACTVMMIHDSVWVETPEAEADAVRNLLQSAMTEAGKLDVPLEVDFERPVGAESKV